jgi:hypothetical protein
MGDIPVPLELEQKPNFGHFDDIALSMRTKKKEYVKRCIQPEDSEQSDREASRQLANEKLRHRHLAIRGSRHPIYCVIRTIFPPHPGMRTPNYDRSKEGTESNPEGCVT